MKVHSNEIKQEHFKQVDFDGTGMNVHRHPRRTERQLAVFVHGFNGKGYRTWEAFPRLLFDGKPGRSDTSMDVAVFRYSTGFWAAINRSVNLDVTVERLRASLAELVDDYSEVFFFCHSLGGLVGQSAVAQYLTDQTMSTGEFNSKIAAVFLFGSPRAGTRLAPAAANRIFAEFSYLSRFSNKATETEKFFTNYVETEPVASPGKKRFLIPRYVCMGNRDAVAEEFSVTFGVPRPRIFYPDLNHRKITKPLSADSPQVRWAVKEIEVVRNLRASWVREQLFNETRGAGVALEGAHYVTELWTGSTGTEWDLLFSEVREEFSRHKRAVGKNVTIHDRRDIPDVAHHVDLLVSLHNAENSLERGEIEKPVLEEALRRHEMSREITVGISPCGERAEAAAHEMENWLAPHRPFQRFYIEPAADKAALKRTLLNWLSTIVRDGGTATRTLSGPRLRDFIDPTEWPRRRGDEEI